VSEASPGSASLAERLWIYQAERFPLVKSGLLIAAFGASAVCVSAQLRGSDALPTVHGLIVAVLCLLGFFIQLRVADEHKDLEDDRRWRPERPVPRGLVTLGELRGVAYVAAAAQLALVLSYSPKLLALLLLVWAWMALMSVEFFVPAWLRARPVLYLISHMAVMPLIDLFATACDWLVAGDGRAPAFGGGLAAFLALSFTNGTALEIGRKAWSPSDEREGVETYSKLWGFKGAGLGTGAAILVGLALAAVVNTETQAPLFFMALLSAAAGFGAAAIWSYIRVPTSKHAHGVENAAGLWVFAAYVFLGVAPVISRLWP
jgi:4-hydroxybenzoate polyprenyltransferase